MNDYKFDIEEAIDNAVQWLKNWFEANANGYNAVIGISEKVDSFIAASICVKALGKDRVIGVLMPNWWHQDDMDICYKLCEQLGIKYITCDVGCAVDDVIGSIKMGMVSDDFYFDIINNANVSASDYVRMSILHIISEGNHGIIINTFNLPIENVISLQPIASHEAFEICEYLGLI